MAAHVLIKAKRFGSGELTRIVVHPDHVKLAEEAAAKGALPYLFDLHEEVTEIRSDGVWVIREKKSDITGKN